MATQSNKHSVLHYVDWWTVGIYLALVFIGVVSIYAASYDFDEASIFAFDEFSGKQIRWIGLALLAAMVILLIDVRVYENYAYLIYLGLLLLMLVTIFIAPDIKGSRSWLVLGPMSLQPAEFGKFATALALAKLFSGYNFSLNASRANYYRALAIIFVPVLLILAQHETGSALAYLALFFVLYREGMSGFVLLAALMAVVFFVVAIKFSAGVFMGIPEGQAIVMGMIMLMMVLMLALYCRHTFEARNMLLVYAGASVLAAILSICGVTVNGYLFFLTLIIGGVAYIAFIMLHSPGRKLVLTACSAIISLVFLFSVNYTFDNILREHQQKRIAVALGLVEDLRDAGYNVNQSKIAIGSGGFAGKGFLNGTQTKLKYVPEQHTDFIFCTIGEEEGFIGSAVVIALFLALILRVISLAERQTGVFGRVYAYCVASFFIFHLAINVGMVIGLVPVIGIPLPFFSYGGSSLWGFTFLLFILLRIDASRRERPGY